MPSPAEEKHIRSAPTKRRRKALKSAAGKKAAAKKALAKKVSAKKTITKKTTVKRATAKKVAVKRTTARPRFETPTAEVRSRAVARRVPYHQPTNKESAPALGIDSALSARAYTPNARARALLRGKEIREADIKASGGAFSLEEVENFLGISEQNILEKVRDDGLLEIPAPEGRRAYPAVQFIEDGIVPGLRDVLKSLPSTNSWFRLNFLVNSDIRLNGRAPIDLLKMGKADQVIALATMTAVQGA